MAGMKIAKHTKQPTLAQEVAGLTISTNLMKRELVDVSPKLRTLQLGLDGIRNKVDRVLEVQDDQDKEPPPFTAEQFNQLAMAVNKIAAYAAAMDETKKQLIKLTSERIDKLDRRTQKLRVRLRRLKD